MCDLRCDVPLKLKTTLDAVCGLIGAKSVSEGVGLVSPAPHLHLHGVSNSGHVCLTASNVIYSLSLTSKRMPRRIHKPHELKIQHQM